MASDVDWSELGRSLRQDGYCRVPQVLDGDLVIRLREAADERGERWAERMGESYRAQGSMVALPQLRDPVFGELVIHPPALRALDRLGLTEATFTDGYVISKPPKSPRLFWHFDWYGWTDPSAHDEEPLQVFVMYYLTDTTRENGCLRVIPGSHRRRHPLHDLMTDGHAELSAAHDLERPEFDDWPEEVDVTARAGDALIGDARLLHAAHANASDDRRSLVTLWYQPHYPRLPATVQATLAAKNQPPPEAWPPDLRAAVIALQPVADPGASALPRVTSGPRT